MMCSLGSFGDSQVESVVLAFLEMITKNWQYKNFGEGYLGI